ncbi:(S)-2,3-di-O-geranylgeranylglyceryl phosphate synthase [Planctomycetes bacterium Pan216]|uniref:(S)-2,3-di-O-geranylgeranylglyceryl phosphate synthase n=1 Tax=Kolteria novifilia TaxID=2527975 RepID=A0A518B130_9BACT|nr:(S)-2,3-di-O-geranylgeranylglyceryl phosphate synthase [Planctomycetes bacterium Pan216]
MTNDATTPSNWRVRVRDHLRLIRFPNTFTAAADIFLGGWLATSASGDLFSISLLLLAFASASLYAAGIALNDIFDLEIDREERPERPLPSGRVSLRAAIVLSSVLIALCLGASAVVGFLSLLAALLLLGAIFVYDGWLKQTPAGPLAMGLCRLLNVIFGITVAIPGWSDATAASDLLAFLLSMGLWRPEPFPISLAIDANALWLVPLANGVYIVGVTWFARQEASISNRGLLAGGAVVIAAGLAIDAAALIIAPAQTLWVWVVWLAFTGLLGNRVGTAISDPSPQNVQRAVKAGVLGLVIIDGMMVLGLVGLVPGIVVCLLLVPALYLGRWIYVT